MRVAAVAIALALASCADKTAPSRQVEAAPAADAKPAQTAPARRGTLAIDPATSSRAFIAAPHQSSPLSRKIPADAVGPDHAGDPLPTTVEELQTQLEELETDMTATDEIEADLAEERARRLYPDP